MAKAAAAATATGEDETSRKKRRISGDDPRAGAAKSNRNHHPTDASSSTAAGAAAAAAAAAIQQKDWGIAEVLAECGATLSPVPLPPPPPPDVDGSSATTTTITISGSSGSTCTRRQLLGCHLDSTVTPGTLRASVHALLREMDRNGIDPGNRRVLESLEDIVASGCASAISGGGTSTTGGRASGGSKHGLLKRMLLPTYRIVPVPGATGGSTRGVAATDKENVGNAATAGCLTPRSGDAAAAVKNGAEDSAADKTSPSGGAAAKVAVQTFDSSSLVRTLLRVDALQSTLLTALLQKLPEFASEDDDDDEEEEDQDIMDAEVVDPEETQDTSLVGGMGGAAAASPGAQDNDDPAAAAAEEKEDDDEEAAKIEIPRLILSQIRWLDHVVDSATLTEASLEVLSLLTSSGSAPDLSRPIVLDLIATLPDVVDETKTEQIDRIVETLTDVRTEDDTLLIPCLDALSSLRLTSEQLRGVTGDALRSLQSAEVWCLPALCKFLVQNAPPDMCEDVVTALREVRLGGVDGDAEEDELMRDAAAAASAVNADGRPDSGGGGRRRRRGGSNGNGTNSDGSSGNNRVVQRSDAEYLMLESFAQGMQYRPDLSTALITATKKTSPSDHGATDIWLLLCCAVAPHNKSRVKSIFRSKATSGGFTPNLLADAIRGNGRALSHLFSTSALDLADGLVRSPEAEARGLGGALYAEMFREFSDPMQRQETVGSLVTHIASGGTSDEIDAAMKVFSTLTGAESDSEAASSLRPFRPYLSSLLDHVRGLTPSQLRRLFMVLFTVGGNDDDGDDDIGLPRKVGMGGCDDVQIVIRKYLSLAQVPMKRIGIIGAVAYAVTSSANVPDPENPEEIQRHVEDAREFPLSAVAADIINVLDQARTCCTSGTQNADWFGVSSAKGEEACGDTALAHLFDELCLAVRGGRLAAPVKNWILENFSEALEDLFLGDMTDPSESEPSERETQAIIDDPADRAIVTGTSGNPRAPRGAMRYNIDGDDALVYVKFLPLAASNDPTKRNSLAQLGPLLRLLATCHDVRYGGDGLTEIDAVVGCPLLLPAAENVNCEGFGELDGDQQLAATMSSFYAASWCRELVNTFIYCAAFPPDIDAMQGSLPGESQILTTPDEIRRKLIEKLEALIEIQEDLRFCTSKAPQFTPPGLAPLVLPKQILDLERIVDGESSDDDEEDDFSSESNAKLSKEEKKAVFEQKNAAKKRAAMRAKSKSKLMKLRAKYEDSLAERSLGALRPLSSLVCLALGFPECSVISQGSNSSQNLSMCADAIRKLKVGGPLMTLLFAELHKSLDSLFPKKKLSWLKSNASSDTRDEELMDNPYLFLSSSTSDISSRAGDGHSSGYNTLDDFLSGHVFISIYEHMATIAEIRGGGGDDLNDDVEKDGKDLKECTSLIFACMRSILDAQTLTASTRGRKYLEQILKQLSAGDRSASYDATNPKQLFSLSGIQKSFVHVFDTIEEIIMGGESDDLAFVMDGVECLEATLRCALRVDVATRYTTKGEEEPQGIQDLRKKLSNICHGLLKCKWSDDTKYNKNTVGKLITLYIENSCIDIPSDSDEAATIDVPSLGRLEALTVSVNDILGELPNTTDCKGPVGSYPTCISQSFGSLFAAVLNFLPEELAFVYDSSLAKSNMTAEKTLDYTLRLLELLNTLFTLTKENPELAKRPFLLSQLRAGTTFLNIFNAKAVKYFETHFTDNESSVVEIIRLVQTMTRQMSNVITHGKREKDANLIRETPRAKRVLETFLHKIKVLMSKNHCVTAMWGGNLKEKRIDGTVVEEIYSSDEDGDDEGEEGEQESGDDEEDDEDSDSENEYESDED